MWVASVLCWQWQCLLIHSINFQNFYFLFCCYTLAACTRNHCQIQLLYIFCSIFCSKSFIVLKHALRFSGPFLVNFCIRHGFNSIHLHWLSSFLWIVKTFSSKKYFAPLNGLGTLVNNHLTICVRLISQLAILFHWSIWGPWRFHMNFKNSCLLFPLNI